MCYLLLIESVELLVYFHLLVMSLVFSLCVHVHILSVVVRRLHLLFLLLLVYHNCIVCFVYFHLAQAALLTVNAVVVSRV